MKADYLNQNKRQLKGKRGKMRIMREEREKKDKLDYHIE